MAIESTPVDGHYRIGVRDNGIGIDARYLSQIFELGLKLDKARGGGPGYGLYLAKRVAESHGGAVDAPPAPRHRRTPFPRPPAAELPLPRALPPGGEPRSRSRNRRPGRVRS